MLLQCLLKKVEFEKDAALNLNKSPFCLKEKKKKKKKVLEQEAHKESTKESASGWSKLHCYLAASEGRL